MGKNWQDEAIEEYNEAIRLDQSKPSNYGNRGNAYHRKGQYDEAIRDYSEAIRLDLSDPRYYYNRGDAYFGKDQYDEAIRDYSEAAILSLRKYDTIPHGDGNIREAACQPQCSGGRAPRLEMRKPQPRL